MRVIASTLRKGNIVEIDGKLGVIMAVENIHPGKGTPVTQLEMRRISDGVKVNERYKTTDTLEKAFIDESTHNFLYHDGDHYIFMHPETFDQVSVLDSGSWPSRASYAAISSSGNSAVISASAAPLESDLLEALMMCDSL